MRTSWKHLHPKPTSRRRTSSIWKGKRNSIFVFVVQVFDHNVPSTSLIVFCLHFKTPLEMTELFTFSGPLPPTCPAWIWMWNLIQCRRQSAKAQRLDPVGASQIWMMGKTTLLCRQFVRSLKLAWPGRCKEFGKFKGLYFLKNVSRRGPFQLQMAWCVTVTTGF